MYLTSNVCTFELSHFKSVNIVHYYYCVYSYLDYKECNMKFKVVKDQHSLSTEKRAVRITILMRLQYALPALPIRWKQHGGKAGFAPIFLPWGFIFVSEWI